MVVTPYARTWLEKARHVRVLHIFDNVCNLIDNHAEILSLVSPQIGRGPFNIVVPPLRFPDHITLDDLVFCHPACVQIGELSIDLVTASIWNPRPAWNDHLQDRITRYRPLLIRALQDFAPADSLVRLIVDWPKPLSDTEAAILQIAREAVSELIAGLQIDTSGTTRSATTITASSIQEGVAKLAGLGIGATPAGDDWLVGGTLAFWSRLADREAQAIGALIAGIAARRTIPLSAAWLWAVARGECHEDWHTLLESIQVDDEGAVLAAAATLIRHGHTSGADALTGFVMILASLPDSHKG